jgi:dihydrofolate synthase/folylpolyglutamate synthase
VLVTWQDALDFLYLRENWEVRSPDSPYAFELDRIRHVLADLGNPENAWPAVHVAGTNGKGSTSAYVATALQRAGYRVGLFTSPHMHTIRERAQVDRALVSQAFVLEWLNTHRERLESYPGLTTFEALTALAFSYFTAEAVDVAVVEVGLGGRLDTTNVVHPAVSIVTPVGLDHTHILGDTLAAVAFEKAGILRPGVPAVTAPQEPAVAEVLARRAAAVGAPLTVVGVDAVMTGDDPVRLAYRGHSLRLDPPLRGAHQRTNAGTAATALLVLAEQGWRVPDDAIRDGIAATRWPGRFESLPPGRAAGPEVIVDGAHNPHAAAALVETVRAQLGDRKLHLILGFGAGKDVAGMIDLLAPLAATIFTTKAFHPRALGPRTAAAYVRGRGFSATAKATPAVALEAAVKGARPGDVVLATGSIFVAAAVREAWFLRAGLEPPPSDGQPVNLPRRRRAPRAARR